MKSSIPYAAMAALQFFTFTATAQRFKLTDGSIDALKGETFINSQFTYNDMPIGKFEHEAGYIEKKTEYNTKEPGRGNNWAKSWVSDRKMVFGPKFIDLWEKSLDLAIKPTAKYTLIFHTTTTEPGYNIYVTHKNAEIDA